MFHQPIAAQIGENGYTTTLGDLMFRALTQSDNTCNDIVLRHAGGPSAVRAMLARNRLDGIRFGPGERLLQAGIAGLQWQPAFSHGNAFFAAREPCPPSGAAPPSSAISTTRSTARRPNGDHQRPRPAAARRIAVARIDRSACSSIMSQTHTGPNRLRGGLAPGWTISHKTGTGQVLGGEQAGYNDIGILHAPDGHNYALAVMIGRTARPLATRMALMQNVVRAAIAYRPSARRGNRRGSRRTRRTTRAGASL